MDEFALRSHQRAAHAQDEGRFANEIVPLEARVHPDVPGTAEVSGLFSADEGVRRDSSLEKLACAAPGLLRDGHGDGGVVVADLRRCPSAVLIMSEERASSLGLHPTGSASTPSPWRPTTPKSC